MRNALLEAYLQAVPEISDIRIYIDYIIFNISGQNCHPITTALITSQNPFNILSKDIILQIRTYFTLIYCSIYKSLPSQQSMNNISSSSLDNYQGNLQTLARTFNNNLSQSQSAFSKASLSPSKLGSTGFIKSGSFNKLISTTHLAETKDDIFIIDRLMELQGECKIRQWQFIKFNLLKAILILIVLIVTVFGLFALKYSPWFRKKVFFDTANANEATHVYITGNDKKNDIVKILKVGGFPLYFEYKKLRYSISQFNSQKPTPVAYQFQRQFDQCFKYQRLKTGLSSQEVAKRKQLYGLNQHLVETPTYPQYLLDVMTEPFFLLQYFFCFIFFIQGYAPFSIALLFFSFITTTINYIMLYISYKKIKEIAQKTSEVSVMRDSTITKIDSKELVPGDVYIPEEQQQVPADCIVGFGDIYVNEANLTGESFPIGKFKIEDLADIGNSSMWIYEGSKVLETKVGNTFTVVINTGFGTHRGRIIRKILNRTVKDPDILRTTLIFVLEVVIVGFITFFATLFLLVQKDIDRLFIFFKFIDFLASSAPPPLPIFFNLAYSFSLFRLGYLGITGTEPQKTVDGAQIKTFCFDKTGTLTRNDVSISKIFKISHNPNPNSQTGSTLSFHNIIAQMGQPQHQVAWQLFATCHTTKLIKDQLLGDEIDKQMFKFINAKMETTTDPNIRFIVKSNKQFIKEKQANQIDLGREEEDLIELERKRHSLINMRNQHNLEVLRINQFESKFQSMSVLIRDVIRGKYYIFAKGSPEKLLANCSNIAAKSQDSNIYTKMIKTLSLNGFRTIAMGYKELKQHSEIEMYLKADRQKYLEGIINLGLIAFENRLKIDTWLTIHRLVKSNIEPKMITGDNIYIAVQTARRSGILGMNDQVVFLEGNRNLLNSVMVKEPEGKFSRIFEGTIINKIKQDISDGDSSNFTQQVVKIHQKTDYLKGTYIFAVDNTFLTMNPPPLLSHNIKVFARIPPENKAFVIRQYKKQHNEYIRTHYSKFTRWLKTKTWKIGMCGDGANDLLALREADLSIGIQATDASYGSSFTVKNMLDVDWVIKESKCTQANIIILYQFYGSISFLVLICSIIMITDYTYFATNQLMYLNFGTILLIPGTLAMSRPYDQDSEYVPDANMMGLHNHLMFWGNLLIPFGGVLGCWFYYSNTDQFIVNTKRSVSFANGGFNSKNHCTTLIFLLVILTTVCNGFIMYRSKPWRERFFHNYLFTLLIIANLTLALVFAFMTTYFESAFEFQPISNHHMGICIGIMFGALAVNWVYNLVVNYFRLDQKSIVLEKEEAQLVSYIEKKGKVMIKDSMIQRNIGDFK